MKWTKGESERDKVKMVVEALTDILDLVNSCCQLAQGGIGPLTNLCRVEKSELDYRKASIIFLI